MGPQTNKRLDSDEFMELVERYRDEFFRYILRQAWDPGMAEDIFASALLAAFENRHKFQSGTNFRAWMYRIVTNKCYVANRHTGRAFASLDEVGADRVAAEVPRGYTDVLAEPEKVIEACGDELYRAFKLLSEKERACILLRGVESFSYKEIAEIIEIPVGTVMTHLARGRAKLRKELTDYAREQGVVKE